MQTHLRGSERDREHLVENYTKQITELERTCASLKLSLSNETQSAAKVKVKYTFHTVCDNMV